MSKKTLKIGKKDHYHLKIDQRFFQHNVLEKPYIYISFFGQCEYDIFPLYHDWQNWQRTFCEHWNEDKKGNTDEEKIHCKGCCQTKQIEFSTQPQDILENQAIHPQGKTWNLKHEAKHLKLDHLYRLEQFN